MANDSLREVGGNQLSNFKMDEGAHTFATDPYTYRHVSLEDGQTYDTDLDSCTVFVRGGAPGATVLLNDRVLQQGDSAQLERVRAKLTAQGGQLSLLVAGVAESKDSEPSIKITPAAQQYKVSKPWGHELWLNGEHPSYVLKEVFLMAGNRTSLQFHQLKRETNVVFDGTAQIVYRANPEIDNMDVSFADLGVEDCPAGSVMDVWPHTLHRVVAKTDIYLYEVSTPHLDDVVRVHDDAGRGQGRIQSEHAAAAAH